MGEKDPALNDLEIHIRAVEKVQKDFAHFMLTFSYTELFLYRLLLFYANVSDDVGRAIFSGTRTKPMMDNVTRILSFTNAPTEEREQFAYLTLQLSEIYAARNLLIHHGAPHYGVRGVLYSTELRLKSGASTVEEQAFSSAQLLAMTRDLEMLGTIFVYRYQFGTFVQPPPTVWPPAWRYKSVLPKDGQGTPRAAGKKQPRQRPTSHRKP